MFRNSIAIILLVVSHAFPLYGLLYLGWSPYATVLLFNIETLIITFFFAVDMLMRLGTDEWGKALGSLVVVVPSILFFNAVHFVLSTVMFGAIGNSLTWTTLQSLFALNMMTVIPGLIIMFVNQTYEFFDRIQRQEYKNKIPRSGPRQMGVIHTRILFMQFTIIFGGFLAKASGHVAWGVSLIIILQFVYSFIMFRKQTQLQKI